MRLAQFWLSTGRNAPARRALAGLVTLGLALLIAGCASGAPPMSRPALTNTPDVWTAGQASPAQALVPSPLDQPAVPPPSPPVEVTSAPLPTSTSAAVAALTAMPYPQRYATGGATIAVTPIPSAPQVVCSPGRETVACYDELLDLEFRYPAFMGTLRYTTLRQGGYSGFAYEYVFDDPTSDAGGRSSDFGEGRGPRYTDQGGFGGRSAANICAEWQAVLCQELGPHALLIGLLPKAERLCGDVMPYPEIPRGILILDLPQHPLIQGFAFSFPLLGPEDAAEFRDDWYSDEIRCAPENHARLNAYVEQLRSDLAAGVAPIEMQERYNALAELARSVRSKYFGGVE